MKKILLFFMGILCSLNYAWAEDVTLFSLSNPTGPTDNVVTKTTATLNATISGGTAELYNGKSSDTQMVTSGSVNLGGSSNSYLKITLTNGTFEVGDYIQIGTANTFKITSTNSNSNAPSCDANGKYTIKTGDALIGKNTVYVWKNSGSTFASLTIVRPDNSGPASTDASLSGITCNGIAISGFKASTISYNLVLAYGTETVPTIAATTTDGNATATVTQATSLPGKAIISVTAQDEETIKTYEVNISTSSESPNLPEGYTKLWAANDWDLMTARTSTYNVNGITTYNVAVDGTTLTDETLGDIKQRFNFGGTGAVSDRRIEFPVDGPCEIIVWGSNGNTDRCVVLHDGTKVLAELCTTTDANKNTVIKESYNYTGTAKTLYAYSKNKGYYILAIGIKATSSQLETSDLSLTSEATSVEKKNTTTVTYTTSSTGEVTVSSNAKTVATATVDTETKTITIFGVAAGTATITVSQAEDDTYAAGEKTITVSVTDAFAPTVVAQWGPTDETKIGTFLFTGDAKDAQDIKINTNTTTIKAVKFGSSIISNNILKNYLAVYVEGGFKAGDIVSLSGAYNNSDDTKIAKIAVATGSDNVIFTSQQCINGRTVSDDPTIETFTLAEDADCLYIGRDVTGSTSTFMTSFCVSRPITIATPTINASGYGTFSCAKNVQITGAKVYKATLSDDKIVCTEIESGLVPAGTGVLLYNEGATEALTATALYVDEAPAIEGNDLKATTLTDGSLATSESALALSGDTFKSYTGSAFAPNKAYFAYANSGAKELTIVFDNTTAISNVETTAIKSVRKAIVNGKLMIMTPNGNFTATGAQVK